MTYDRQPLQVRLAKETNDAFTQAAKESGMTRAALLRSLVLTYLANREKANKPKREPRKPAAPKKKVAQTTCVHGNRGLCMQCAKDRAAAEM